MRASECGAFKCFPWHNACAKCFFCLSLRISYLIFKIPSDIPRSIQLIPFFQTGHAGYSYSRWDGIFYEFWIWKASTGGFILQTNLSIFPVGIRSVSIVQKQTSSLKSLFHVQRGSARSGARATDPPVVGWNSPLLQNGSAADDSGQHISSALLYSVPLSNRDKLAKLECMCRAHALVSWTWKTFWWGGKMQGRDSAVQRDKGGVSGRCGRVLLLL